MWLSFFMCMIRIRASWYKFRRWHVRWKQNLWRKFEIFLVSNKLAVFFPYNVYQSTGFAKNASSRVQTSIQRRNLPQRVYERGSFNGSVQKVFQKYIHRNCTQLHFRILKFIEFACSGRKTTPSTPTHRLFPVSLDK